MSTDGLPKFETTGQGTGKLAGVEIQWMATYWADMKADGSLYGECPNAGVVMAADGVATFRATGAGAMTSDGGSKFRGTVYFDTKASSLASLNGKAIAYEWDVAPDGSVTWELWHWA
tara:strand:- start:499 stop:849 length:351 start_codon:yes stop_codon:yes gene_type:complete